jgi:CoA:oxalate CoA-transferase
VSKALEGVTVIDLTTALAGPYGTFLLAALGARVIKVENPRGGDNVRHHAPYVTSEGVTMAPSDDTVSLPFLSRGRGKESVTLDLKHPEGPRIFADLVRNADVVVENYASGVADRLGVGYEAARAANPRIVYCAISGFGADDAGAEKAYDTIIQGLSGIMLVSGLPGDPPVKIGMAIADLTAPLFGVIGILGALQQRERTGEGQFVDVSMLGALTSLVASEAWEAVAEAGIPVRTGISVQRLAPFGIFRAADGWVSICAPLDDAFRRLCGAMGRAELAEDPRFATHGGRVQRFRELDAEIEAWTSRLTVAEATRTLRGADVAVGEVREPKDAVRDPRVLARGETMRLAHPVHGEIDGAYGPGLPVRFSAADVELRPPPLLGEHNESVYRELAGYDEAELARLAAAGAI